MGKRLYSFELSNEDISVLQKIIASSDSTSREVLRSKILLFSADSTNTIQKIADELGTTITTVKVVRAQYAERGIDIVHRKSRVLERPVKKKINDEVVTRIIEISEEAPPAGEKCWTLDLLCQESVKRGVVSSIGKTKMVEVLKHKKVKEQP